MEFFDVIKTRKSVRGFSDKKVDYDKIKYILECARLAPSWMNKQCWRFIIVQDCNLIEEIVKTATVINKWFRKVPVIIIACADPLLSGKINNIEYYKIDTAIAMEHIILAANDIGLGTCWISGFNEKKLKKLLEIPPRIRIIALTPLGYPKEKKSITEKGKNIVIRSTKRKSLKEIIHFNKW